MTLPWLPMSWTALRGSRTGNGKEHRRKRRKCSAVPRKIRERSDHFQGDLDCSLDPFSADIGYCARLRVKKSSNRPSPLFEESWAEPVNRVRENHEGGSGNVPFPICRIPGKSEGMVFSLPRVCAGRRGVRQNPAGKIGREL